MVRISLTSNAREVIAKGGKFPAEMSQGIARAMDYRNQLTVGHIQERKLSQRGTKTLGVVTNRLRGSVRASRATVSGTTVESTIGSNVRYAAVHEYGFRGTVSVKAHTRRAPQGDRFLVGGKQVSRQLATKLGVFDARGRIRRGGQTSSGVARVKAHKRKVEFPARKMFETGIVEQIALYGEDISKSIVEAWAQ